MPAPSSSSSSSSSSSIAPLSEESGYSLSEEHELKKQNVDVYGKGKQKMIMRFPGEMPVSVDFNRFVPEPEPDGAVPGSRGVLHRSGTPDGEAGSGGAGSVVGSSCSSALSVKSKTRPLPPLPYADDVECVHPNGNALVVGHIPTVIADMLEGAVLNARVGTVERDALWALGGLKGKAGAEKNRQNGVGNDQAHAHYHLPGQKELLSTESSVDFGGDGGGGGHDISDIATDLVAPALK